MTSRLDLGDLRRASVARSVHSWAMPLSAWDNNEWYNATSGELGEAQNLIKKISRAQLGFVGNGKASEEALWAALGAELADVAIYLDLWCAASGLQFTVTHMSASTGLARQPSHLPWRARQTQAALLGLCTSLELQHWHPDGKGFAATWALHALEDLAQAAAIDLPAAIVATFNSKSEQLGFPDRLALVQPEAHP